MEDVLMWAGYLTGVLLTFVVAGFLVSRIR